jgi:hypothetical protein
MKTLLFIVLLTLLISGCGKNESKKIQSHSKTLALVPLLKSENNLISDEVKLLRKDDLVGIWGMNITENAAFVLQADSMYYVEDPYPKHFYEIRDGYYNVYVDNDTFKLKILYFKNDTISFSNDGEVETYIRR